MTIARRSFLQTASLSAAGLFLPESILKTFSSVGAPVIHSGAPVRIRGRVRTSNGRNGDVRGIPRVVLSDGLTTVVTDREGYFEYPTTTEHDYLMLSLPSGYTIPKDPHGSALLYRPIQPDTRGEMQVAFDLVPTAHRDEHHAFFVLADPQTRDMEEMGWFHTQTVPDVQKSIRSLGLPEVFGVGCGDLMFDDLTLFPEYCRAVAAMEIPFFQVIGNHDLDKSATDDRTSASTFSSQFGPTYYSFNRGSVHYVVLDDVFWNGERYSGVIPETQLHWLAADLAHVERGSPVVVFLHIPVSSTRQRRTNTSGVIDSRHALYRLLEPYRAHIMSGHTHENEHVFDERIHEHIHGTVCGAWWNGPVCRDGTPNGYGVYEVRGEELRWRYQSVGFSADHQMRVYNRGADAQFPSQIVANVWNWDPQWKIVWYEDGERKGAMTRRTGLDPHTVTLYGGDALPVRRPKMEPEPTDHLFYAPVSPQAREIRVEATDPFGNVFTSVPSVAPLVVYPKSSPPLRVMTFNLKYASVKSPNSWVDRRPVVKALIQQWKPDVIGTQEGVYSQLNDIASDLPDYAWLGLGREGGSRGEFMAVFYRKERFEVLEYDHFWLSDTPDVIGSRSWGNKTRRMVTWVRFRDRPANQEFIVVNTHFDHKSEPSQHRSAELILQRFGTQPNIPTLLLGDFNAQFGDATYLSLTRSEGFVDAWSGAEKHGELIPTSHGFEGITAAMTAKRTEGKTPKDWILSRGSVKVKWIEVITFEQKGQYPSDHFPVFAEMVLGK